MPLEHFIVIILGLFWQVKEYLCWQPRMLWPSLEWELRGLRGGHVAAVVSTVRPTLAKIVYRVFSGQSFCLIPVWTMLSLGPWAIGFVLELEFALGFLDWFFSSVVDEYSFPWVSKKVLAWAGITALVSGWGSGTVTGMLQSPHLELKREGLPRGLKWVWPFPTPRGLGCQSNLWLLLRGLEPGLSDVSGQHRNTVIISVTQHVSIPAPGCIYLMLDPQTNRSVARSTEEYVPSWDLKPGCSLWICHLDKVLPSETDFLSLKTLAGFYNLLSRFQNLQRHLCLWIAVEPFASPTCYSPSYGVIYWCLVFPSSLLRSVFQIEMSYGWHGQGWSVTVIGNRIRLQ